MDFSLNKAKRGEETSLVPTSMDLDTVRPKFDEYLDKVGEFEAQAEALVIHEDQDREVAANLTAGAKKMAKAIDERRKEIAAPAEAFCKSIKAFADKFISRLKSAAEIAGKKELQFIELQEMKRREQEKLAREAAEKLQRDINKEAKKKGIEPVQVQIPLVPEVKTTARTEAGVTSYVRKIWVCEVYDWTAIPFDKRYWAPSQKKLDEAVESGERGIAGCKIYEKSILAHRS